MRTRPETEISKRLIITPWSVLKIYRPIIRRLNTPLYMHYACPMFAHRLNLEWLAWLRHVCGQPTTKGQCKKIMFSNAERFAQHLKAYLLH